MQGQDREQQKIRSPDIIRAVSAVCGRSRDSTANSRSGEFLELGNPATGNV